MASEAKVVTGDLGKIAERVNASLGRYKAMLMVCTGTACVSARGFSIRDSLVEKIAGKGVSDDYLVVGTGCNGYCAVGPIIVVQPEGVFYQRVTEKDLDDIIEQHLLGGTPVERLLHEDPATGRVHTRMAAKTASATPATTHLWAHMARARARPSTPVSAGSSGRAEVGGKLSGGFTIWPRGDVLSASARLVKAPPYGCVSSGRSSAPRRCSTRRRSRSRAAS